MRNFLNKILNKIAKHFSDDPSGMLIITGVTGWILSSTAQMCAVLFNQKIEKEQKSYLLGQELADAAANIACFFAITKAAQVLTTKLFKTGKFAPKSVREFIKINKSKLGDKIGKLDFNLEEILQKESEALQRDYNIAKDFGTTVATITGVVLASNLATPIVRNNMATSMQKKYINYKNTEINQQPTFKSLYTRPNYSKDLRI